LLEENVRNIKLTVAYDGSAYHGFQRQANAMTIQQILEERLATIFGHDLNFNMSARTDTGVHAYGQIVNFYTTGSIPVEKITAAAKSLLPHDIVVCDAQIVHSEFHARFDAKSKIYKYQIYNTKIADPFLRNYAWHIQKPLDSEAMHKAVQFIVGTHDFSAFRASGGAPVSPVRTILSASVVVMGK
jgi:tRNA pseudouridine38-40 synthase